MGEFDAALGLWRGQPYADMSDAAWAAPEIARLDEVRLSVVEGRCEAQLALGDPHSAVAELELHVRDHSAAGTRLCVVGAGAVPGRAPS